MKKSKKTIELRVKERIYLPGILPQKGKYTEMLLAQSIIDAVKITPEEIAELNIQDTQNGGVSWNGDKLITIELRTEQEVVLLKNSVKALDEKEAVTIELLSLCKKIEEL